MASQQRRIACNQIGLFGLLQPLFIISGIIINYFLLQPLFIISGYLI